MAVTADQVVVELEARLTKYTANLAQAQQTFDRRMALIERSANRTQRNLETSFGGMAGRLNAILATVGVGLGLRELQQYADAWTQIAARLTAVGIPASRLAQKQEELFAIAQKTRAPVSELVQLYGRLEIAANELGTSEANITKVTETLAKALQLSGASTAEAASAMLQFSQAIGSGVLQGDELRALRENAPLVAQAIAKEFNTTVGGLKKLGEEGKLTSDRVIRALLAVGGQIDAQFAKLPVTIGQSFTVLQNAITRYIGQADAANGISKTLSGTIIGLANNIDTVAKAALLAGVSLTAMAAPRAVAGIATMAASAAAAAGPIGIVIGLLGAAAAGVTLFGDRVTVLSGELGTVKDYAVAAFEQIGPILAQTGDVVTAAWQTVIATITDALSGMNISWQDFVNVASAAINGVINAFRILYSVVVNVVPKLPAVIGEAIVNTLNSVVEKVELMINRCIEGINLYIQALNMVLPATAQIGEIGAASLGRIKNNFKGAGEAAAQAFGDAMRLAADDHVAAVGAAVQRKLDEIRLRANELALIRATQAMADAETGGTNTPGRPQGPNRVKPPEPKKNAYDEAIRKIKEATLVQQEELKVLGLSTYERTKALAALELEAAARKAKIPINDKIRQQIEQESTAYANWVEQLRRAKERQQDILQLQQQFGNYAIDAMDGLISKTKTWNDVAAETLRMLAKMAAQAALLGEGPLAGFFGTRSSNPNTAGGLFGLLGGLFGGFRAGGGPVQANKSYIVGEKGPELVRFGRNGSVVPNKALVSQGSRGGDVYTINADMRDSAATAIAFLSQKIDNLERSLPDLITGVSAQNRRLAPG